MATASVTTTTTRSSPIKQLTEMSTVASSCSPLRGSASSPALASLQAPDPILLDTAGAGDGCDVYVDVPTDVDVACLEAVGADDVRRQLEVVGAANTGCAN